MNKPPVILASLALVLLAGCPPSIIDLSYDLPTSSSTTTTGTGGADGGAGTGGTGGTPLCMPGATASCYDGPAGTEGVGICKAGTHTCAADGTSWGPCMGEVLPQMEDCASGMDQNCDGTVTPCPGTVLWAKRFGDASYQAAVGVAVDSSGNVLVTGDFAGSVDFGGGPLMNATQNDQIFVTKLDPLGGYRWARGFGSGASSTVQAVAVDGAGNVLVARSVGGSVDLGDGPFNGGFVVKFDPDSNLLWSKGYTWASVTGVAVDGTGEVLVTGLLTQSMAFGCGSTMSPPGAGMFAMKLDASGACQWAKEFAATEELGSAIAVDSAGNVLLAGYFRGTVDFGNGVLTSTSPAVTNIFVAKLDAGGNAVWSKTFGSQDRDSHANSVAVDGADNVLVTGDIGNPVDFGGGALPEAGIVDGFVVKFSPAGDHVWSKHFGVMGNPGDVNGGASVAVDAAGNVLVTGAFTGSVDFGDDNPLASAGGFDGFIAKLKAADGTYLWSTRFGDAQDQAGQGIAADASGNMLMAGTIKGSVHFGPVTLTSAGDDDVLVAKFSP